jgi:tetratricopeptide (TPR) repeat protein
MISEPSSVGPYDIEGVLGRGGMGVVYRARDPAGRQVALKCITVRDDGLAQRLVREADVRVVHRNVVRVLGAGLDAQGEPYLVTELLEGESLEERLKRPIELPPLLALFAQAADGLAAIHAAGIVHRDIKPSNLFVTRDGTLKLLDFGVATFSDASTVITGTGALIGTPAYISPEQARGERAVDARADLWSLGMSLYRALTGDLPFRRSSVIASALAVQHDPLPSVLEHVPTIPLELAALVERCLARRAEDRPESAAELARLLRSVPTDPSARPSQPLLARTDETWRTVAVVLIDGADDRERLKQQATALGGTAFPVLARSAVIVFGGESSRGDELERAIDMALASVDHCRAAIVGDARARASGREIDPASLRAVSDLLERDVADDTSGCVLLTAEAAAVASPSLRLEQHADGTARVLDLDVPTERTRLAPGIDPEPTTIGREPELEALERAARRASTRGLVRVDVVGAAGMGKTVLVDALVARLPSIAGGASVVIARARHTARSPYAALLEALDVAPDERAGGTQDALDRRRIAVLDRLGELLVGAELLVLVIEDVHDADRQTIALLAELGLVLGERPLLIVTTARRSAPEDPASQLDTASTRNERIALTPLGASAIGALVEPILGREVARRVAGELTDRAGGNPLFAIHLARLASARGAADGVVSWDLPPTVESAVQAELDTLPEDLRRATHTIAVLGNEGTLAEARLALGSRGAAWITKLMAADVLERPRGSDPTRWQFKSRVVAEVAYAALDAATAARLHRELAVRLAASSAEGSAGDPELVLRHAERGGDEALTARFVREAFLRAARIGDGRRVLELLPRARASNDALFSFLFMAAEAAAFVTDSPGPEPLLREAWSVARTADDRALVLAELGERARRASRLDEARAHLERALAESAAPAIATRARCRIALVHVSEGDAARALAFLDVPDLDALPGAVRALVWDTRGYVHGARGALGPRREAYERAAALYAEQADARRAAGANANLGDTLRQMGDLSLAESALRRAIEGARRVGNGLTDAYASTNLAATLLAAGRPREALATLDVAAKRAVSVDDRRLSCVVSLYRARAEGRAPSERELEAARRFDPTLHATALAVLLEHGEPTTEQLDEAAMLLERGDDIEEGALEIGRALYAWRPTERVRALVLARIDHTFATLGRDDWRGRFVAHVERAFGQLAEPWIASTRSRR